MLSAKHIHARDKRTRNGVTCTCTCWSPANLLPCPLRCRPRAGRSWYAFGKWPTQAKIQESMDVMVNRSRLVDGVPTSLADLGFTRASLDGRWPSCPDNECACDGINGSFHDHKGWPVVNKSAFPDMKGMVAYAHSLKLTAGQCAPCSVPSALLTRTPSNSQLVSVHHAVSPVPF